MKTAIVNKARAVKDSLVGTAKAVGTQMSDQVSKSVLDDMAAAGFVLPKEGGCGCMGAGESKTGGCLECGGKLGAGANGGGKKRRSKKTSRKSSKKSGGGRKTSRKSSRKGSRKSGGGKKRRSRK